jgi:hypothetical protein
MGQRYGRGGPHTVNCGGAVDDAWAHLAPRFGADAPAIEVARLKLVNIILSLGTADSTDAEQLKSAAPRIMELDH